MNDDVGDRVHESAGELYREIRNRGLHLRHGDSRDDILINELCESIGCPDDQLQSFLDQQERSAEWFIREFLQLAAPFARMFSEIWGFLSTEGGPRAKEDIRIRFGFEGDDVTEVDLGEFREWARTARKIWIDATMAYWTDEALNGLFGFSESVALDGVAQGPGYSPWKPYQLPPIDTHHDDEFEEIVRRVRNLFQNIIDAAAEVDEEEYYRDVLESENEVEDSISSLQGAVSKLHDLLPRWEEIFRIHHEISNLDRRQAVDYYKANIAPKLQTEDVVRFRNLRRPLDILRLPFWKHRWHTYEIWATVQTLKALDICDPQVRVVDDRIPIDGHSTEIVADLNVVGNPHACVVTQLETPFPGEEKTAIKPDLSICRTQDFDAESRAVVIEFKQRLELSSSHVEEVSQQYLSGSPEAVGLVMVNYDAVPDARLPKSAKLLGNVRPGSASVTEFHGQIMNFMEEADLIGEFEQKAVLVDVSGSMGGEYENPEVKDALRKLVEWRDVGLQVNRFSDGLPENPRITIKEVEAGLETGGSTNVISAIEEACKVSETPKVLLIVTDGEYQLPESTRESVEILKECSPQDLPSELEWLRSAG